MSGLRPHTLRIFVRDLERALRWYEQVLGLGVAFRSGVEYAALATEGISVALEVADEEELVGRFVGLSFEVEELEAWVAERRAQGVGFEGGVRRQPWGGLLAHALDPEGNAITLVQMPS